MKVKFLKKLRKRYSWSWNPGNDFEKGYWTILDHKEKKVEEWREYQNFITSILGFESSISYMQKLRERENRKRYNQEIKLRKNEGRDTQGD
jgi:hypothetical protein